MCQTCDCTNSTQEKNPIWGLCTWGNASCVISVNSLKQRHKPTETNKQQRNKLRKKERQKERKKRERMKDRRKKAKKQGKERQKKKRK